MKKFLKISLLIFATMLIVIGCKKETDASLINVWEITGVELKDITFAEDVSLITQASIRAALTMVVEQYGNNEMMGGQFEFRENNVVLFFDPDETVPYTGTYSIAGDKLTISTVFGVDLTGTYSISKNRMFWDIEPTGVFFNLDDLPITSLVFRFTLNKR